MTVNFRKESILAFALPLVKEQGWERLTLEMLSQRAGVPLGDSLRLFPEGVPSLADFFLTRADDLLSGELLPQELLMSPLPQRLQWGIMRTFELEREHKSAIGAAIAYLLVRRPWFLPQSLLTQADSFWRFVGDASVDFNYHSKRFILAPIYGAVRTVWLEDKTADHSITYMVLAESLMRVPSGIHNLKKRFLFWRYSLSR